MERAFKFRIYPTAAQKVQIAKTIGCARFVYNDALDCRRVAWEVACISLNYCWTNRNLTIFKQQMPFLQDVDKFALQNALRDLDVAYKNFFAGRANYPKFKRKHSKNQSYRTNFTNNNITVTDNTVKLPKLGKVKAKISRSIQGRIINATVSRTKSGKYFVSICCADVEIQRLKPSNREVGIDLGIKDFAITSDGEKIANPKYLKKSLRRLKMLQRRLSRKSSGSQNRNKARIRLARMYEYISNQRENFLHQITTRLIRNYDLVCIEDLNVRGMMSNRHLAKAVQEQGFFEFRRQIEYKAAWKGLRVVIADRFYPSSKTCIACGHVKKNLRLSERIYHCEKCGNEIDRDLQAAINLKRYAS